MESLKFKPSTHHSANYSNTKFILSCSNIYHCGVFVNQKISINHGLMDMLVYFMHACGGQEASWIQNMMMFTGYDVGNDFRDFFIQSRGIYEFFFWLLFVHFKFYMILTFIMMIEKTYTTDLQHQTLIFFSPVSIMCIDDIELGGEER